MILEPSVECIGCGGRGIYPGGAECNRCGGIGHVLASEGGPHTVAMDDVDMERLDTGPDVIPADVETIRRGLALTAAAEKLADAVKMTADSIGNAAAAVVEHAGRRMRERRDSGIEIVRPADRAAWLAARRLDVTASVAGCLLGVHPYTTAYGLWAAKTGRLPDDGDEDSPAMRRGRLLEPVAIEMLREERPEWEVDHLRDNVYWRDPAARLGATPDAFATRPDVSGTGVVQVKTSSDYAWRANWRDPDTGDVSLPLWIAVQAIVEAHLTGAAWAAVAVMIVGRGIEMHVIDVPIHAGVTRRVRETVAAFWKTVEAGGHPPVDWMRDGPAVLDVYRDSAPERRDLCHDPALDGLVASYVDARAQAAAAAKVADTIKPQIIAALGNAEAGETSNWLISAKTQLRKGYTVAESQSRPLRVKARAA